MAAAWLSEKSGQIRKTVIFAGGIPLKRDGKVVSAIGVSGGTGEQDQVVAEAGAAGLAVPPP